jgi:hypothetical protein
MRHNVETHERHGNAALDMPQLMVNVNQMNMQISEDAKRTMLAFKTGNSDDRPLIGTELETDLMLVMIKQYLVSLQKKGVLLPFEFKEV